MNLAEIRQQLDDAIQVADVVVAQHRGDPISGYPAAVINIDTLTADTFLDGSYAVQCTVTVLVSQADTEDGWQRLDALLSDDTIAAAFRDAECVSTVGAYDNIGDDVEYGGGTFFGFTIAVEVLA